jgi:hypothetical protein
MRSTEDLSPAAAQVRRLDHGEPRRDEACRGHSEWRPDRCDRFHSLSLSSLSYYLWFVFKTIDEKKEERERERESLQCVCVERREKRREKEICLKIVYRERERERERERDGRERKRSDGKVTMVSDWRKKSSLN